MDFDESIVAEFALEAREHLESVEHDLLLIAQGKEGLDVELIHQVFRSVHSIKGGAGFLSLPRMQALAHEMETLLDQIRDDPGIFKPGMADVLLDGTDLLNLMMEDISNSDEVDIEAVHQRLVRMTEGGENSPATGAPHADSADWAGLSDVRFDISPETLKKIPLTHEYLYILKYDLTRVEEKSPVRVFKNLQGLGTVVDAVFPPLGIDPSQPLPDGPLWCVVLYSTILGPDFLDEAVSLPEEYIFALDIEKLPDVDAILVSAESGDISFTTSDMRPAAEPDHPLSYLEEDPPISEIGETAEADSSPAPAASSEMLAQFVLDTDDLLEQVEGHLGGIGKNSDQNPEQKQEVIGETFRLIHSLKGRAELLGLTPFERFTHEMEHLLDHFRNTPADLGKTERDLLLKGVDALQDGLWELSVNGSATLPEAAFFFKSRSSDAPAREESIPSKETVDPEPIPRRNAPRKASSRFAIARGDIRVDLDKLDLLINLVGELVIAESMVTKNPDLEGLSLANFDRSAQGLRRIISDLQDVAISVRMVSLSGLFRRLTRMVRDLSSQSGKPVKLELTGEKTEVDKSVIEQIGDPLAHLIRNSIDHGIESKDTRRSLGKPATGSIRMEAGHEGGEILIRISDDGRGLNPEKIRAEAVKRGLASEEEAGAMAEEELFQFLLESGFSTHEAAADTPGRGIGLEVVKRNIEKLRGRIDLRSAPGEGAVVELRIPLTMAIMDGMLIRVGAASYTIPLQMIRESFRPTREQITITMGGREWVRVRDSLMPIIRLHRIYNLVPDTEALDQGILINAVSRSRHVCLFVDEIIGHHQAVIKRVPEFIGDASGVSGCTILDNGSVGLILDIDGILKLAERTQEREQGR